MSKSEAKYLLWCDLETAGTDAAKDPILEIAVLLTTPDLEVLSAYETPVWPHEWDHGDEFALAGLDPYVYQMHSRSGLLDDCARHGISLRTAESEIVLRLSQSGDRHDFVLAGSGVSHFDRRFIAAQVPELDRWLRYYSIDVGVLRRSLELIGRSDLVPALNEQKPHRAMADIRLHLAELRHYRAVLGRLVPMFDAAMPISVESYSQFIDECCANIPEHYEATEGSAESIIVRYIRDLEAGPAVPAPDARRTVRPLSRAEMQEYRRDIGVYPDVR